MKVLKNFGFTIVELIIVVIIIGVLVGIAVPNYIRSVEIAKCSQAMSVLKNMRTAELEWFRENDIFTANISDLETQVGVTFADNNDWAFTIAAAAASTFTLQANRQGGPNGAGTIIEVNEVEDWTGSSYPYTDPGGF